MEEMDCDSPANSINDCDMDSDTDQSRATKKPKLLVNVKSLTMNKNKHFSPQEASNETKSHLPGPLIEILQENDIEDESFKNKLKDIETRGKVTQKAKGKSTLHLRLMNMNEEEDMSDEDFNEDDKENRTYTAKNKQKVKKSKAEHFARFLNRPGKSFTTDEESEDDLTRQNPSKRKKAPAPQKSKKAPQAPQITDGNIVSDEDLEDEIVKLNKLTMNIGSDSTKEKSETQLSLVTMEEENFGDSNEIMEFELEEKEFDESPVNLYDPAVPGCSKTPDLSSNYSLSSCDSPGPSAPRRLLGDSDSESDGEPGSLKSVRNANKRRLREIVENARNQEVEDNFETFNSKKGKGPKSGAAPPTKKRRTEKDTAFRFSGLIPTERRRSARLLNLNPQYTYDTLDDVHETVRYTYFKQQTNNYMVDDYLPEDLEKVVHKPQRKSTGRRKPEEHVIIHVNDVTQEMLDNIARTVKGKVYSADGTTCHQCRQKTMDQKTCCRNPECYGIFGMFCGVCIKNRYGEDAAETLLNPNWICPVCRGRCNCSICRTKQGKRPTGVLAPLAQQSGYDSVDQFLDYLKGEGDRPKDDKRWILRRDPKAVLGFSDKGRKVNFQDGSAGFLACTLCAYKDCENPDNLLGFSKDGNTAIMGGYREEALFNPKTHFFSLLRLKQI